jgi:hypothetical protein
MTDDRKEHVETVSFAFEAVNKKRLANHGGHEQSGMEAERRCEEIEQQVNEELWRPWNNVMRRCEGEYDFRFCFPLRIPEIEPLIGIVWGDSPCDCIEGDDTETMTIIVCNRYSNVALTGFTINRIVVVQADGSPVPTLPNGDPSIELVPLGPYCFDDIPPCTCVVRQFVLRLRGAPGGQYRILLQGICFEVCVHQLQEQCFTFEVCRD